MWVSVQVGGGYGYLFAFSPAAARLIGLDGVMACLFSPTDGGGVGGDGKGGERGVFLAVEMGGRGFSRWGVLGF